MNPTDSHLPSWLFPGKRPGWVGWVAAVALVAFSTLLRLEFAPYLGQLLFFTYFPAVMAAGWFGGFGPGVLATGISAVCVDCFLAREPFSFSFRSIDLIRLLVFCVSGLFISALHGILHSLLRHETDAKERFRRAEQELRIERAKLSAIIENIPVGIGVTDEAGRMISLNRIALDLHGFASEAEMPDRIEGYTKDFEVRSVDGCLLPVQEWPALRGPRGEFAHDCAVELVRKASGTSRIIAYSAAPIREVGPDKVPLVVCVMQDITEQKRTEAALNAARDKLQQHAADLERMVAERTAELRGHLAQLEEFSYTVSHDLRAPLRAMEGYATAVLEDFGPSLDAQGQAFLRQIIKAAQRMDQLTRDVLAYSRVSRESVSLIPFDLEGMVRDILDQYPQVKAARAEVIVRTPLHIVMAQESLLAQALSNLIGNAVKFVPPGTTPRIEIYSEFRKEKVRLCIKDNGIGVAPMQQARLFGLFERIDPSGPFEGTGIGLAIVRKAAERMGGAAGLESDGVSGSTFWIELLDGRSEKREV